MNVAKKVRDYKTANPSATIEDIAKACETSTGYVYQVMYKMKQKKLKAIRKLKPVAETTESKPSVGQEVLRKEIKRLNAEIDKWKNLSSFHEQKLNVLLRQNKDLKDHHSGLEYVISYLEARLGEKNGASV